MKKKFTAIYIFIFFAALAAVFSLFAPSETPSAYADAAFPVISVSTEQYAQKVTVTIDWGGAATKQYALTTPSSGDAPIKINYTQSFDIDKEGTTEVRAYYWTDGEEKYVSREISNIDKTAPNKSTITETFRKIVNLKSSAPAVIEIRCYDSISGIKEVYHENSYGVKYPFTPKNGETGYWQYTLNGESYINICAADNAGNITVYNYDNRDFDYAAINSYAALYASLEKSAYTDAAWSLVENAFSALGQIYGVENPDTNELNAAKTTLTNAVKGGTLFNSRLVEKLDGLNVSISYAAEPEDLNILLGETVTLYISNVAETTAYIDGLKSTAVILSGYKNAKGYAFRLELKNPSGADIDIVNSISVTVSLPAGFDAAKIYSDSSGILTLLGSQIEGDSITFQTNTAGDFYMIADAASALDTEDEKGLVINGRFYSAKLLGITGGIILAVILAAFFIPFLIIRSKQKKARLIGGHRKSEGGGDRHITY